MSDPNTVSEYPPWWDECESMGFGDLREFLDHSLDNIESGTVDDDQPQTEELFLALADMLESKIVAIAAEIPAEPPRPAAPPGYSPYLSEYFFTPSRELRTMQVRLDDLQRRREEARYDYRDISRTEFNSLGQEIAELGKQVRELEASESRDYPKRCAANREAGRVHSRNMRQWKARVDEISRKHEALDSRATFVQRRRQRIRSVFTSAGGPSTKKLRWRVLPRGKLTREGLKRHYNDLSNKNQGVEYDFDRIEKAMDLRPKELHEEIDATVEGYIVFTFEQTPSVLLECPRVGNAIYVIHHDWEHWSKMSKHELMNDDSGAVARIPHQGDWYARVKRELGFG